MATSRQNPTTIPALSSVLALAAGLFLAVALIKWGNPIILEIGMPTPTPTNFLELIYSPWPIQWAYWGILPIAIIGAMALVDSTKKSSRVGNRSNGNPVITTLVALPAVWLIWQLFSGSQSVDPELTRVTLTHFAVCAAFFYVGYFGLQHRENSRIIWVCLIMALLCVLRAALEQHFGGLEATRKMIYQMPDWQSLPPLFLKRIAKNRVFGTLFYPNSLAGAILLLLPICVCFLWASSQRLRPSLRWSLVLSLSAISLAVLFWSESKAGWLLAVVIGMIGLWHSPANTRWKKWLTCAVLVLGLAVFGLRHAGFFQKGATSVVARVDYWRAALHITGEHPILGSGPGTFYVEYRKIKSPEAEMSRLCHNDYLQQASDSGLPGAAIFTTFLLGSLFLFYRQLRKQFDLISFGVLLGMLGYSMHSFVEFHLYIPALSWTAFFLMGWILAQSSIPLRLRRLTIERNWR